MTFTPPFSDIAPWPPTRYTPPLREDFESAFDRYAKVFAVAWVMAFGYALEAWQVHLIRAVLEVFPEGHPRAGQLRWRQVVASVGRQNGKTELAAALGLWRLLSKPTALVIGIASSADQARIVYQRAMQVVNGNAALAKRFSRTTETRGLQTMAGGRYELKAAKSAALQGLPIDLGLVDELHLLRRALWGDLVSGTGGRPDCLVVGITTAGDSDSELLIDLYRLGERAIADDGADRVFFAAWEAPEARVPDDDETMRRYLAMANPAVASGRVDLDALVTDMRTKTPEEVIRYHFNRFLSATRAPFIEPSKWLDARIQPGEEMPRTGRIIFSVDAAPGLAFASIVATTRGDDGRYYSDLVASLRSPDLARLFDLLTRLSARWRPAMIAIDGSVLRQLASELRKRGLPVFVGNYGDAISASVLLYRLIKSRQIVHGGDDLRMHQIQRATRKNTNEAFVLSRADSSSDIDGLKATALGLLAYETAPEAPGIQVW